MFRVLICDLRHPNLWDVATMILRDLGQPIPKNGCVGIPGEFAWKLHRLEKAADALYRDRPAPEDYDAMKSVIDGEGFTDQDSEFTCFVLGEPDKAEAISKRIPHGPLLLDFVNQFADERKSFPNRV